MAFKLIPEHKASAYLTGQGLYSGGFRQRSVLPCGCLAMSPSVSEDVRADSHIRDHVFRHVKFISESKPFKDPGFVDPTPVKDETLLRMVPVSGKPLDDDFTPSLGPWMSKRRLLSKEKDMIERRKRLDPRVFVTKEGSVTVTTKGERRALKDTGVLEGSKDVHTGEVYGAPDPKQEALHEAHTTRVRPMTPAEFRESQTRLRPYIGKNIDLPDATTNVLEDFKESPPVPGVVVHEKMVDPATGRTIGTTTTHILVDDQPVDEVVVEAVPLKELERIERANRRSMGKRRSGRF